MTENNTEEKLPEEQPQEVKYNLTPKQKRRKILLEAGDLLKGAAFPFIIMCIFSTTIIMFASYDEIVIQVIALILGEAMLIAAFILLGRSNGSAAYKAKLSNETKRKLKNPDEKAIFRTGEYAVWKGFVIGFITTIPFLIFQIIACTGEYSFVEFILEYACGWAVEPLNIIGSGAIPDPYYLLMAIIPIGLHGGFYMYGKWWEDKRQQKITRAEDDKRKGKKKHYYEENRYEKDRRYVVKSDKNDKEK